MNRFYKLLLLISIIIGGCKSKEVNDQIISQSINSMKMNIFTNEGQKLLTINSPYSYFDNEKNIYNLKETTIRLFKDNLKQYVITSDESKLSNNKLLELNGNVIVKTFLKQGDRLYANSFTWNMENSEFLLLGNVKFENELILLSSNKAILNKANNIIEFFNPVQYSFIDSNNERGYQVNSENAYYNIETNSVSFSSKEERVRSKIYF